MNFPLSVYEAGLEMTATGQQWPEQGWVPSGPVLRERNPNSLPAFGG
jgi:hypothetical protein